MTRCRDDGNGYPATGGLWAGVGQSPLSAVGTGREMREDLLKGLGLLEGESHEFMTVPISGRGYSGCNVSD